MFAIHSLRISVIENINLLKHNSQYFTKIILNIWLHFFRIINFTNTLYLLYYLPIKYLIIHIFIHLK